MSVNINKSPLHLLKKKTRKWYVKKRFLIPALFFLYPFLIPILLRNFTTNKKVKYSALAIWVIFCFGLTSSTISTAPSIAKADKVAKQSSSQGLTQEQKIDQENFEKAKQKIIAEEENQKNKEAQAKIDADKQAEINRIDEEAKLPPLKRFEKIDFVNSLMNKEDIQYYSLPTQI